MLWCTLWYRCTLPGGYTYDVGSSAAQSIYDDYSNSMMVDESLDFQQISNLRKDNQVKSAILVSLLTPVLTYFVLLLLFLVVLATLHLFLLSPFIRFSSSLSPLSFLFRSLPPSLFTSLFPSYLSHLSPYLSPLSSFISFSLPLFSSALFLPSSISLCLFGFLPSFPRSLSSFSLLQYHLPSRSLHFHQ